MLENAEVTISNTVLNEGDLVLIVDSESWVYDRGNIARCPPRSVCPLLVGHFCEAKG